MSQVLPSISPNNSFESSFPNRDQRKYSRASLSTRNTNDLQEDISSNNSNINKQNNIYNQQNLKSPNQNINSNLPILVNNNSPLKIETKFAQLETKIILLEKHNALLNNKISEIETNYVLKTTELQSKINNIQTQNKSNINVPKPNGNVNQNDQSSPISNIALEKRIQFIEKLLEKESEWKNEQRKKDYEMYRNLLDKITEQVKETVNLEIGERFKADMINENNLKIFINKYNTELDKIKKFINDQNEQLKSELENYNMNLGNNNQIIEKDSVGKEQFNSMMNFVEKLALQFKNNLNFQDKNNEGYENRLRIIEKFMNEYPVNVRNYVNTKEDQFTEKIRHLKTYLDSNLQLLLNNFNIQMKEMSSKTDDNFTTLTNSLIDTRLSMLNYNNEIDNKNTNKFKSIVNDMETILKRIYKNEDAFKEFLSLYSKKNDELISLITSLNSESIVYTRNERQFNRIELQNIYTNLKEIYEMAKDSKKISEENIQQIKDANEGIFDNLAQRLDKINEVHMKSSKSYDKEVKNLKNEIAKLKDKDIEIEVKQAIDESLIKTTENSLNEKINKLDLMDKYLHNKISDNSSSIIEIQKKNTELSYLINNSGTNIKSLRDNLKEQEQRDGVKLAIESMIDNCEKRLEGNQVNNELKNVMNKFTNLESKMQNVTTYIKKEKEEKAKAKENDEVKKEVDIQIDKMLNYVEFKNIYDILQNEIDNLTNKLYEEIENNNLKQMILNEQKQKPFGEYENAINNKIDSVLEKIKYDNTSMWVNAVQLSQTYNQSNELRKLIREIPPVIWQKGESIRKIFDLGNDEFFAKPLVQGLDKNQLAAEENRYGKKKVGKHKEKEKEEESSLIESASELLKNKNVAKFDDDMEDEGPNNNNNKDEDELYEDEDVKENGGIQKDEYDEYENEEGQGENNEGLDLNITKGSNDGGEENDDEGEEDNDV